jgi:hypothetical protein
MFQPGQPLLEPALHEKYLFDEKNSHAKAQRRKALPRF